MCFVAAVTTEEYAWLQSTCLAWCLNIMTRYSWVRCIFVRSFMPWCPRLGALLLPNQATKLHDEVKFTCGYPRFGLFFSIALARLANGHSLETFLYNKTGFNCIAVILGLELLEDLIVDRSHSLRTIAASISLREAALLRSASALHILLPRGLRRRNQEGSQRLEDWRKLPSSGGCIPEILGSE